MRISHFTALSLLATIQTATAHSWVEQVHKIGQNGAFVGDMGYPLGYVDRAQPDVDNNAQNKILDTKSNPAICKPKANAYASVKRLSASAGDAVALVYQENGHVTQPLLTPRPYRSGLVSVYGTLQHEDSDGINDVRNAWTADGKGGNGKGKLLAAHFYDDGQCYQNAGAANIPVYKQRSAQHGLSELYCQTDFQLPADLPSSGIYTVMWVWDWPLIHPDGTNTTEIYTSCAEIELGSAKAGGKNSAGAKIQFSSNNPIDKAGIASQLDTPIEATALLGTAAPSSPAAQNPATSASAVPVTSSLASSAVSSAVSSSAVASSPTTKERGSGGVKTVTVTANPVTATQWKTVTVGGGDASASASARPSSAAPTVSAPALSVTRFMRARATGHERRDADYASS
ncbi:hypothetical protein GGS23DRAFT_359422 [Durotheca rogersii]|uniref:uncharacterized protein n=1 Tax=Durotheca rogersii TaxID=419775 RepID=UPI00221EF71C|nr:uncharacterized protein GGS23DRAFT_359422 [Durotheca rogersii]KAI5865903.1 hypothetical protein GGS23DRAFT_359422 [Durotheca rogersii]